jgi:hypothetical protein
MRDVSGGGSVGWGVVEYRRVSAMVTIEPLKLSRSAVPVELEFPAYMAVFWLFLSI